MTGRALQILLVEDSPTDAFLVREALADATTEPLEVSLVTRLADALTALGKSDFDLVLMDLSLPDCDGFPTFERLSACAHGAPIVVLTGQSDDALSLKLLRAGAKDYLVKSELIGRALERALRSAMERQRAEERARQAMKLEAVGRLAGGVAHDFNNLLTVILGCSEELLSSADGTTDWRPRVEEIRRAAMRGAMLTQQLLTFGRGQKPKLTFVHLNATASGLEQMLRRLMGERIEIVVDLDPNLWTVHADLSQMEQVIVNLALNARDAMESGGKLTIATRNAALDAPLVDGSTVIPDGRWVCLSVHDTGVGMDRATLEHVFEPFFTTKEVGRGTGLGLATVHGIVERSGGRTAVESTRDGHGTTFRIYLPAHTERPPATSSAPPSRARVAANGTVLLVEDDAGVRQTIARVLKRQGFTVLEAESGPDGLRIYEENDEKIDLLVSDVLMPRMTGPELLERLRERDPHIRALFVTGYAAPDIQAQAQDSATVLQKPFTIPELLEGIRTALGPET